MLNSKLQKSERDIDLVKFECKTELQQMKAKLLEKHGDL